MALIHESLYGTADLAHVDVREYLRHLTEYLWRSYGRRAQAVTLELEVDRAALTIETAVPFGLILNELVSNALQHAFREGQPGYLRISLRRRADGQLTLSVRDTGVGFPPDLEIAQGGTLGLQLVRALAEQLGGTLSVECRNGTTVTVVFPEARPRSIAAIHPAEFSTQSEPYASVAPEECQT